MSVLAFLHKELATKQENTDFGFFVSLLPGAFGAPSMEIKLVVCVDCLLYVSDFLRVQCADALCSSTRPSTSAPSSTPFPKTSNPNCPRSPLLLLKNPSSSKLRPSPRPQISLSKLPLLLLPNPLDQNSSSDASELLVSSALPTNSLSSSTPKPESTETIKPSRSPSSPSTLWQLSSSSLRRFSLFVGLDSPRGRTRTEKSRRIGVWVDV